VEYKQLDRDLRQLDDHLLDLSGGASLDELIQQAQAIDADSLPAHIGQLDERIAELEREGSQIDQAIGAEREQLRRMDGGSAAADAADLAENLIAGIRADAEQYAVLRLASVVLHQAIDRFRERHQGPILDRASRLFARLTVGSFEGLRITSDDNGQVMLIGVRAGGKEEVELRGMSDGTADQLYLALRLASLETYLDSHEPMPFVVDDILLNFDDQRAVAALEVLAELTTRTQVLFHTHHHHLVDLAERHLDSALVFTHHLPGRK
jgi:uncharacterized protein YhaN